MKGNDSSTVDSIHGWYSYVRYVGSFERSMLVATALSAASPTTFCCLNLHDLFSFINNCGYRARSRIWKTTLIRERGAQLCAWGALLHLLPSRFWLLLPVATTAGPAFQISWLWKADTEVAFVWVGTDVDCAVILIDHVNKFELWMVRTNALQAPGKIEGEALRGSLSEREVGSG